MNHFAPTLSQRDLAGYFGAEFGPANGAFNEVFAPNGTPREHWSALLQSLEQLGRDEFHLRAENGRRILREHGVSYTPTGTGKNAERAWELDFLPLVISAAEWSVIEAGIIQRAHLLDQVLRDLYGTQKLVRNGFLPAPLVHANPAYLRACQAIKVPGDNYIHTYAVDLGRAPDGQWWVLADRTQAPTGMGFALQNRSVVSRVLPEVLQAVRPRSLSAVLRARDLALRQMAPHNSDNPNIVLLTPGPRNEGYFEHAYLARLLSFTLVEGDDLTVRDRAVFIKTLDGLQRADVILRRISDSFCDPLELRSDSLLGVPGLVEATRAGQVAVANALGSGLVESPGFMPFLPGLSQQLLGQDLLLPSIATWWCGQGTEFQHVCANLPQLLIRPAFALAGETMNPARMSAARRAELVEHIRERPHEFVGQESVRLSSAPIMKGHHWEQSPIVLRVFASFNGESYTVMPGGLARVVNHSELASPALGVGGGSKDVWVLGAGEGETVAEAPHVITPRLARGRAGGGLPSRTADNFFWLGRYTERLEFLARVSRCVIDRSNSELSATALVQAGVLHELVSGLGWIGKLPSAASAREFLLSETLALLQENGRLHGAQELLQRILLASFAVRDRLSADTWRILNRLPSDAQFRSSHLPLVHASSVLNTLVLDLSALNGMEVENMTRGHGWTFLDAGRRLERASSLVHLLKCALSCKQRPDLLWEPVLEICDSVMSHRRRYFGVIEPQGVLDLLVAETDNPRSLVFQFDRLLEHAAELPPASNSEGVTRVHDQIQRLAGLTHGIEPDTLPDLEQVARTLGDVTVGLDLLSELITQVFFSHTVPRVN
jgi:uncharacterized circularly permuted ATP-grasp superfamily protein/uncharacterized alpha-E superfamily protein